MRTILKKLVYSLPWLRWIFVLIYKLRGRRPFSLGYNQYKFSYIRNIVENNPEYFRKDTLPVGYGFGLDERVVEYPWLFSKLSPEKKTILDAGSSLNHTDILNLSNLKNCKLYIATLAYEGFFPAQQIPAYVFEDLRKTCFKDEFFDMVVCISTLEHIGMDNTFLYTKDSDKKEYDKYAFLDGVLEFKRLLKKNGSLYITVPFGIYKDHGWFQVFDSQMVDKIKERFNPLRVHETYFKYQDRQWQFSDSTSCRNAYFNDIHAQSGVSEDRLAASQSVVCLELMK